jgi:hypothetical protein
VGFELAVHHSLPVHIYLSGSASGIPGLNSALPTAGCLLIEKLRVCVIQSLQTLNLHLPTMP